MRNEIRYVTKKVNWAGEGWRLTGPVSVSSLGYRSSWAVSLTHSQHQWLLGFSNLDINNAMNAQYLEKATNN